MLFTSHFEPLTFDKKLYFILTWVVLSTHFNKIIVHIMTFPLFTIFTCLLNVVFITSFSDFSKKGMVTQM